MRGILVYLVLALVTLVAAAPFDVALKAIRPSTNMNSTAAVETGDDGFTRILMSDLYEVYKRDPSRLFILDVREGTIYANSHIKGAQNLPVRFSDLHFREVPTNIAVFVYCDTGGEKSEKVATMLVNRGHRKVVQIIEGFDTWRGDTTRLPFDRFYDVTAAEVELHYLKRRVFDIRPRESYDRGHIPRATHLDLRDHRAISRIPFIGDVTIVGQNAEDGRKAGIAIVHGGRVGFDLFRLGMDTWTGPVDPPFQQ